MASKLYHDEHNYFVCSCNEKEQIPATEFNKHLEESHNMKPPHKGMRSMVSHVDYDTHYSRCYKWTFSHGDGFTAYQHTFYRRKR